MQYTRQRRAAQGGEMFGARPQFAASAAQYIQDHFLLSLPALRPF
jgi:hypothetical protein